MSVLGDPSDKQSDSFTSGAVAPTDCRTRSSRWGKMTEGEWQWIMEKKPDLRCHQTAVVVDYIKHLESQIEEYRRERSVEG